MSTTFLKPKNNAYSTLASTITGAALSLSVAAGEGARFPSTYPFHITIDSEILECTSRTGDVLTVTRAAESTTAAAHNAGATVRLNITQQALTEIHTAVNALEAVASARVTHSAAQSISDSTPTVLAFDTERFDTDTIHDPVTNNSRLTCKTAGKYLIMGNIDWTGNANGMRALSILLNGATVIADDRHYSVAAAAHVLHIGTVYALGVGDYVELRVYQSSSIALDILKTVQYSPEFMMVRLSP